MTPVIESGKERLQERMRERYCRCRMSTCAVQMEACQASVTLTVRTWVQAFYNCFHMLHSCTPHLHGIAC